jgi:hypothetical protein
VMKRLLSVFAAIALAGAAYAGEDESKSSSSSANEYGQEQGTGGSGQVGKSTDVGKPGESKDQASATSSSQSELSGEVVKVDPQTVYINHMGAIVPIKLTKETKFEGAMTRKDLSEGKEIRASFEINNNTSNVATEISSA